MATTQRRMDIFAVAAAKRRGRFQNPELSCLMDFIPSTIVAPECLR
jgi:hypothetical protein